MKGPFALSLPTNVQSSVLISGHGTPEGSVAAPVGWLYRDEDNDNVYIKVGGSQKLGWSLIGVMDLVSGQQIIHSSVDPNGVKSMTGPGVCLGNGAMAGKIWFKSTTGTSADDWDLTIA